MDSLKEWLFEVGVKKFTPSAIRGALGIVITYYLAHQGMLEKFGIFYDEAARTLTVHLNALADALDVSLVASILGLVKVMNHHADQVVLPIIAPSVVTPPPPPPDVPK